MELDAPLSPEGVRILRALFLGPSGSGKTTIAGHFIRDFLAWPRPNVRSVAPPTKPTLSTLIHAQHIPLSVTDREAQDATFGRIWREASLPYDQGGSDIGFALDDADFYFSQAGRTYGSAPLSEIVKLGREAGLSQVFVAQGSAAISKDLISNSNVVFIGRTVEPNLLDYARRYMRDVPEAEHVVSSLPKYVFLIYAPQQTPKLQGLAKVVNGRIEVKPWAPSENPPEEEEPSPSTAPSEEATSPDGSARYPKCGTIIPDRWSSGFCREHYPEWERENTRRRFRRWYEPQGPPRRADSPSEQRPKALPWDSQKTNPRRRAALSIMR